MAQAVIDPHADALKAATLPAGTVLAARYRLEELIAESQPTVTWRAFDQVLSRSVLVHLLSAGDAGADDLLAAARRASVATDSRFLRVLDAVHSADPELGSYIVCEYATGKSLELVLSHAPLSALESAWVVREVADALAGVHSLGLFHQRINPDTVIITPNGNVKIVGLLIESALRPAGAAVVHGADTPELVDVTDLGRLLYACLVARWPGGPAYSLPDAPVVGRRWGTPRQVRAGVSPALDQVCDAILGDPPRHREVPIATAHDVVVALTKVLGPADASGDLERRLRQSVPLAGSATATADVSTGAPPVSALLSSPAPAVRERPSAATTGLRPTVVTTSLTRGRSPAAQTPRAGRFQSPLRSPAAAPLDRGADPAGPAAGLRRDRVGPGAGPAAVRGAGRRAVVRVPGVLGAAVGGSRAADRDHRGPGVRPRGRGQVGEPRRDRVRVRQEPEDALAYGPVPPQPQAGWDQARGRADLRPGLAATGAGGGADPERERDRRRAAGAGQRTRPGRRRPR